MTIGCVGTSGKRQICRVHSQRIRAQVKLPALSETVAERHGASILGGNAATLDAEGFSYWAAEPIERFEFTSGQDRPFEGLADALARYRLADDAGAPHRRTETPKGIFCGGWIGFFSYELGRYIERLPATTMDDLRMPLIRLCFYDRVVAYDHRREVFWIMVLELSDDTETPQEKMATLKRLLRDAQNRRVADLPPADMERLDLSKVQSTMSREAYLQAVLRIKRYIRDGDVYQVNLSQRFARRFTGRPIELFHWQNLHNPSPHAAYLDTGRLQIVSASPEMFITIRHGWIRTKPIKGTRRRLGGDAKTSTTFNRRNFCDLLGDAKEQAELNMIIDLERNDLAKICRPGTRRVIQPRTIETYPTVFHAVATIGGELRPNLRFSDVVKAVFPGGSITGAPKIRAMEIIDELEPTDRGVYTGSIGWIGLDGTVCLNIAIRTVIIADHMAFAPAGGGIVADSGPHAEWEETITKARALLAGIQAVQTP